MQSIRKENDEELISSLMTVTSLPENCYYHWWWHARPKTTTTNVP